ncbi:MAG: DUF1178 family protein [Pseudomonadota bacterium]
MKVIDLRCHNGHGFEGWFASDEDFLEQNGRRLIACPLCDDSVIVRLPSAPRLNLSGARAPATPVPPPQTDPQAMWLKAVRHVLANTEDVGERFADEARRIHYGEAAERGIRGQASADEREALRDEGIEVMPLPLPAALKEPLQ